MNFKGCEKREGNIAEISVVIGSEEFDASVNEAYKKSKNQIAVPGFRKGKAPRKIIESMYGKGVFYNDALEEMVPSACAFGMKESNLRLVGYPSVSDVNVAEDKSVDIVFTAAIYPEVKIGEYKGLSAEKPEAVVENAAIDSELAAVQLRNARIETANRPAIGGDTTVIDFEGFIDGVAFEGGKGEDFELVLGSNTFIPGFEEKMNGMTVGEERDLDLVFPENYKEDLAGKPVVFKVKLKELSEKILPELDDEFAKDVSEFDTLDEYKNSIKENLLKTKTAEADNAFENALMDKLIETLECEIPAPMLEEHIDNSMNNFAAQMNSYGMDIDMYLKMMNTTPEVFRESMRDTSEKQLKVMLSLEKIAELEGIEISDEDIDASYAEAAEKYGVEVEIVKDSMSKEAVTSDLKLQKAAKIITETGVVAVPAPIEPKPKKAPAKKTAEKKDSAAEKTDAAPVKKTTAKKAATGTAAKSDAPKPAAKKPKKVEKEAAEEK